MATNISDKLKAITFSNTGIVDKGGVGMGAYWEQDTNTLVNALKSGLSANSVFSGENKIVDASKGYNERTVYVRENEYANAMALIKQVSQSTKGYNISKQEYGVSSADASMLTASRTLHGSRALSQAVEDAHTSGGIATITGKDRANISIPVLDSDLQNMSQKDRNAYINSKIRTARKLSNTELSRLNKIEAEKQDEKSIKEHEAIQEHTRKRVQRENKEHDAQMAKEQKQAKLEKIKQAKEDAESKARTIGIVSKIAGIIVTIADITRRILSSVLSSASEAKKQATMAGNLGTTYSAVKGYNYSDAFYGLAEGTTTGALQSLQSQFGNTASLNTESLKWLAMVMGGDVEDMVRSGLGGKEPEKLLESILNAFYKKQQAGIDQYGNEVGQEQARRSLVTLLQAVSPEVASIFARMVEANTNGLNAGRIGSYQDYLNISKRSTGLTTTKDLEFFTVIGEEVDEISAKWKNLIENIKVGIGVSTAGLLDYINSLDIGKNAEDKEKAKSESNKMYEDRDKEISDELQRIKETSGIADIDNLSKGAGIASGFDIYSPEGQEAFLLYLNDPVKFQLLVRYTALAEARKELANKKEKGDAFPKARYSKEGIEEYIEEAGLLVDSAIANNIYMKGGNDLLFGVNEDFIAYSQSYKLNAVKHYLKNNEGTDAVKNAKINYLKELKLIRKGKKNKNIEDKDVEALWDNLNESQLAGFYDFYSDIGKTGVGDLYQNEYGNSISDLNEVYALQAKLMAEVAKNTALQFSYRLNPDKGTIDLIVNSYVNGIKAGTTEHTIENIFFSNEFKNSTTNAITVDSLNGNSE